MRTCTLWVALLCGAVIMTSLSGTGAAQNNNCPNDQGIAQRYVGDLGIENDPDVIFAENFEAADLSEVFSHWTAVKEPESMALSSDVPESSFGSQSLQITSIGPYLFAYLYKRLSSGLNDQIFLRYYVKYSAGVRYHHSGAQMGGYNPPTNWPQGGAGERPSGSDRFTLGIEPRDSVLRGDFYTYWMHMRRAQDGSFWGNEFVGDPSVLLDGERWICVEAMIKLNNPVSAYNGELALWIDGQPVAYLGEGFPNGTWSAERFIPNPVGPPFEGFQWRTTEDLNLNWIELLDYITNDLPGNVGMIWYDDLVLATSYIGPINTSDPSNCVPDAPEE